MLLQLAEFLSQPLMLDASYIERLRSVASMSDVAKPLLNDVRMVAKEQAAAASKSSGKVVAVIPVQGFIDAKDSWMLREFGGTGIDSLMDGLELCLNEPRVSGIVMDFDTPGGSAYGVKVAADYIFQARSEKPIVSCVRYLMASAGYYLGSATSRIIAEPTSMIGSIGVCMDHYDKSKMLDEMGIKATVMRIPEFKAEGHPAEPLSDAAKANMQTRISDLYNDFTNDVARYRGVTQKDVCANYGMGRVLSTKDALACGMIDKVDTFANVCSQMTGGTMARSLAQSGRMEGYVDTAVLANRMSMMEIGRN